MSAAAPGRCLVGAEEVQMPSQALNEENRTAVEGSHKPRRATALTAPAASERALPFTGNGEISETCSLLLGSPRTAPWRRQIRAAPRSSSQCAPRTRGTHTPAGEERTTPQHNERTFLDSVLGLNTGSSGR